MLPDGGLGGTGGLQVGGVGSHHEGLDLPQLHHAREVATGEEVAEHPGVGSLALGGGKEVGQLCGYNLGQVLAARFGESIGDQGEDLLV